MLVSPKRKPAMRDAAADPSSTFEIFDNDAGRWYALRGDGMVLGIFFRREDALRFARRECNDVASLMLVVDGKRDGGALRQEAA